MFHDKSLQSVGIDSAIRSRVRFPPVRYHFFQSVQTISSSKGDMSYLHEGKKKEHSREREREKEKEREREYAKLVRFWLVHFRHIRLRDLDIPTDKWLNCFCKQ